VNFKGGKGFVMQRTGGSPKWGGNIPPAARGLDRPKTTWFVEKKAQMKFGKHMVQKYLKVRGGVWFERATRGVIRAGFPELRNAQRTSSEEKKTWDSFGGFGSGRGVKWWVESIGFPKCRSYRGGAGNRQKGATR